MYFDEKIILQVINRRKSDFVLRIVVAKICL
jgi:hypothetical protein